MQSDQRSGRPSTSWNAVVIEKVRTLMLFDSLGNCCWVCDLGLVTHTAFWMWIWACTVWQQNLCPSCFDQNTNNSVLCLPAAVHQQESRDSEDVGLWVRPRHHNGCTCFLRFKKAWQVQKKVKMMLVAFLYYQGIIVYHEYVPEGETINKEYDWEDVRHVHHAVRCKRPELAAGNWQLHHGNALAHSSYWSRLSWLSMVYHRLTRLSTLLT